MSMRDVLVEFKAASRPLRGLVLFAFCSVWFMTACCSTAAADGLVDFSKQIAPIFEKHCVRCHSPGNDKGDVSLVTFDDLKLNDFVTAGDPDDSYLIELVTSQDGDPPAMPKEAKPLSDGEVDLLRHWIRQGAKWPDGLFVKEKSKADASWWAYQPLKTNDATIDEFIRAKLAEHGLTPSPPADRRTLIRRLSFDLHGLPPTPEAVDAFVNDGDPKAYEKLVDQMLESPHYGERFARHWLDIAHYADTHGFERDKRRDNAWRYRDYVIRAFNEDKPYDRFLQEQIAGDVLWPDNEQAVIATGFLAAGPWDFVGQVETKKPHASAVCEVTRSGRYGNTGHDCHDGDDYQLRKVSRPQARSDLPAGVLPVASRVCGSQT